VRNCSLKKRLFLVIYLPAGEADHCIQRASLLTWQNCEQRVQETVSTESKKKRRITFVEDLLHPRCVSELLTPDFHLNAHHNLIT
jgi:hypothetical protein